MYICYYTYIYAYICAILGLPGGSDGKESAYNTEDLHPGSLDQEDPLEKGMATHSNILA